MGGTLNWAFGGGGSAIVVDVVDNVVDDVELLVVEVEVTVPGTVVVVDVVEVVPPGTVVVMELVVVVPPGTVVVVLMVLVVAEPTGTTILMDGALEPHAFVARRHAKYRPGGATAEIDVAVLPVSKLKRFVRPAADPTSSTLQRGAACRGIPREEHVEAADGGGKAAG